MNDISEKHGSIHEQRYRIKKTINQTRYLIEQRRGILSLPPDKALERILNAHHPGALVRSFQKKIFIF
jgi:hypothetical protein